MTPARPFHLDHPLDNRRGAWEFTRSGQPDPQRLFLRRPDQFLPGQLEILDSEGLQDRMQV